MVALDFFGHPLIAGDSVVYIGGWGKEALVTGTVIKVCKKQILIAKSGPNRFKIYKYPANVIKNTIYETNM